MPKQQTLDRKQKIQSQEKPSCRNWGDHPIVVTSVVIGTTISSVASILVIWTSLQTSTSNNAWLLYVLTPLGIMGFVGCVYFYRARTSPLVEGGMGVFKYPRLHAFALLGLITVPLLAAIGSGYYSYQQVQTRNKVILLVANLDGPEPQKYRVTETVLARLRQALARYDDVQILALGRAISEAEGSLVACDQGNARNAAIVIWGWYGVTREVVSLSVHFEVMNKPKNLPKFGSEAEGSVRIDQVAELESFSLQTRLSAEMAYLRLFTVGMTRYRANDWNGAIGLFTDALLQTEDKIQTLDQSLVYDFRGLAYANKGDYEQSMLDYDRILELGGNRPNVYYNRGLLFYLKGDLDRAIADYNQAINLKPNYVDALHNRGVCYADKSEYDRAIADYNQVIQIKPDLAVAYGNRGISYAKKGDLDHAIADYTQFIKLDPNDPNIFLRRASAYLSRQDYDRAISDLNQSIRLQPNNAWAYIARGFAYTDKRAYDNCIADFSKVIALMPDDVASYNHRAICSFRKQDFDSALADLNYALSLDSNYANTYFNRGIVYRFRGEKDKAIADFSKFLELSQDPDWRKQAEIQLKALEAR